MAQIADIEKLRKKRSRKAFLKRLLMLLLAIAVVFAAVISIRYAETLDLQGFLSDLVASFGSGGGFPVDFPGNTAHNMEQIGSDIAVLTDSSLYIYNGTAKQVRNVQHNYVNPVAKIAGNRVLLYDVSGYNFRIDSKSKTLYERKLDNKLIAADYASGGRYAILSEAQRYLSQLVVYEKDYTELFTWYSRDNYATGVDLTDDGRYAAVSALTTSGGMIRSSVIRFSVNSGEELFRAQFDDALICAVRQISKDRTCVVLDDRVSVLSADGSASITYSFYGRTLLAYEIGSGGQVALLFAVDGSLEKTDLVVLDSDAAEIFSLSRLSGVQDFAFSGSQLLLCDSAGMRAFDRNGETVFMCGSDYDFLQTTAVGGRYYALTGTELQLLAQNDPAG